MKHLLILLLAASSAAEAGPIVEVTWEGTVTRVASCVCGVPGAHVGDAISGMMTIDPAKAPADSDANPSTGVYQAFGSSDFIDTTQALIGSPHLTGADSLRVSQYQTSDGRTEETYSIYDGSPLYGGSPGLKVFLGMGSTNPDLDLIHGDGIAQSFTATYDPQNGVGINGQIESWKDPVNYVVQFVVNRLTVKTVCRA